MIANIAGISVSCCYIAEKANWKIAIPPSEINCILNVVCMWKMLKDFYLHGARLHHYVYINRYFHLFFI